MNNTEDFSRLDGNDDDTAAQERTLYTESGVLPKDFPQRLERLKEASGLSWRGLARALGVDSKQLLRWRKDVEPCGGAMFSIFRFAAKTPGGLEILLGEGFQMSFFREAS